MALRLLAITLLFSLLAAGNAAADQMSGLVDLRYAEFRAEEDGERVEDASHFVQRYSFLYTRKRQIHDGRGGWYDLGLGAEWVSLDSKVNGADFDVDDGKILFRGELNFIPRAVPFRLHLYSRDFKGVGLRETPGAVEGRRDSIIDRDIITGVENARSLVSGATILLGAANSGTDRGALPRLLLDYREYFVRNLDSASPQHHRTRELAFVSLNKKNNWFHYRQVDYADFLNPSQDFMERKYILGTVDHAMRRRWVNLTNWIKVSADGSFTTEDRERPDVPSTKRFDLNLFAKAKSRKWAGSTFGHFRRQTDGVQITRDLEIPIFLRGELDRDTAWRLRLVSERERDSAIDGSSEIERGALFLSGRVEAFRRAPYRLDTLFETEFLENGEGSGLRGGFELYSNSKYHPRYDTFGSYHATVIDRPSRKYQEHRLKGRVEASLGARGRIGLEEAFLYGTGDLEGGATDNIVAEGDMGLIGSDGSFFDRNGDTARSTTTFFVEHRTSGRLDNRLEAIYDSLSAGGVTDSQTILRHRLDYDKRRLYATLTNDLTFGDQISDATGFNSEFLDSNESVGGVRRKFVHSSKLRYSPGRYWEGSLRFKYERNSGRLGESSGWDMEQGYRYSFYETKGLVRKLGEFRQELEYQRFRDFTNSLQTATIFSLGGDYYPSRRTRLAARIRYAATSPVYGDELSYSLSATMDFSRLQLSLDYDFGMLSPDDDEPERIEHRWELKVRRTF